MASANLYDHGHPFSETLAKNLDIQYERVWKKKKASLIIVDGGVGEGKTTLAVEIADYFNKKHGLPPIDLEVKKHPQLGLGGKEFMHQLRACYTLKLPAIVYDEAGDFNRKGAISRFNQMLMRVFETFRAFRVIVILALPNFGVLEGDLFDAKIPRMLIHCHDRTTTYGNFSVFSLAQMGWLRFWYGKYPRGRKHQCFRNVYPNFRGHFLDIEKERSRQLDRISTSGKIDVLKQAAIQAEGLLTYSDMAKKLGRSISWVRKACYEKKIKHKRSFGVLKYFEQHVLDRLVEIRDGKEE